MEAERKHAGLAHVDNQLAVGIKTLIRLPVSDGVKVTLDRQRPSEVPRLPRYRASMRCHPLAASTVPPIPPLKEHPEPAHGPPTGHLAVPEMPLTSDGPTAGGGMGKLQGISGFSLAGESKSHRIRIPAHIAFLFFWASYCSVHHSVVFPWASISHTTPSHPSPCTAMHRHHFPFRMRRLFASFHVSANHNPNLCFAYSKLPQDGAK